MMPKVLDVFIKGKTKGECGLPKIVQNKLKVNEEGAVGDYNLYRTIRTNSDKDRAVLFFPIETIRELKREGWTVKKGELGENILIEGIRHDEFKRGMKLEINGVELEVTKPAIPCKNLGKVLDVGDKRVVEFVKTMKDRRGWFAKVTKAGEIQKNDIISLIN